MSAVKRRIEYMALDELVPATQNPRAHDLPKLRASIERLGVIEIGVVDERTGQLVSGHGRAEVYGELAAAQEAGVAVPNGIEVRKGRWFVPIVRGWASANDAEASAAVVALNRIGEGLWNEEGLAALLGELDGDLLELSGFTSGDLSEMLERLGEPAEPEPPTPTGPNLAERFLVPPFSVLDARQGYWQDRKRAWLELGIRSEEGRAHNLLKTSDSVSNPRAPNRSTPASASGNDPAYYWKKQEAEKQAGRELTNAEFEAEYWEPDAYVGGTSIFDPVLCEIAYRWWSPEGGLVVDPFAGGSVRGVVAGWLGRRYHGFDLSEVQVAANREQWATIAPRHPSEPAEVEWAAADSAEALRDYSKGCADFVFSCPPYFDLERYSDDPADLSNAPSYDEFIEVYRRVIHGSVVALAEDRFACFVVGDIRDSHGNYRGLVPDTIRAFRDAGAEHHNEAILVTAVGSLALRGARIFSGARRLGKAHQNVLVFCKGDPKKATAACGPIEVADVAELFGTVE